MGHLDINFNGQNAAFNRVQTFKQEFIKNK